MQDALIAAYDEANRVLNLQVVAQVQASDAHPARSGRDVEGIFNSVFDPATNTIRVVEVLA